MGCNITAASQTVETTAHRVGKGDCFVAEVDGRLVGTATLVKEFGPEDPEEYKDPQTVVLGQFGVLPEFRKLGVGLALMDAVKLQAFQMGYATLALDTPQPATHLIEYYQRRGFKLVGSVQWPGKTYLSVLMSLNLDT